MFYKYLWRELGKRRKQTSLIATGLGVAIALVVVVAGVSNGIKTAQAQALSGLYGIGTDITVSQTQTFTPGQMGQHFQFGATGGAGSTSGSKQTFNKNRLEVARGSATLTAAQVAKVASAAGVSQAVATLKLNSTTFNGTLPAFNFGNSSGQSTGTSQGSQQGGQWTPNATATPSAGGSTTGTTSGSTTGSSSSSGTSTSPTGGFDGKGGSSFSISSFSIEGVPTVVSKVGPLAGTSVTSGRTFTAADSSNAVAVIDSAYAKSASLKVGKGISIGGAKYKVIGIVASASASATTPSNVYIPIAMAQKASSNSKAYTTVYVAAKSSSDIAGAKAAIAKVLPKATVSTEADLASQVSGSLATASNLINQMGSWLALIVLLAAFATSILFTTSGVNRRVREFGTLKAIGWRSRRIVAQVMGESIITGLIGGIAGIALGAGAIAVINAVGPTVSASVSNGSFFGGPGMGGPNGQMSQGQSGQQPSFGGGSGSGMFGQHAQNSMNLALHSSIDPWVIIAAIGFAILGGLLAGAFGGLRAARLSPAQALRSLN